MLASVSDYEILPSQLAALRAAGQNKGPASPILLDVREPWEVSTASLPGSVSMPMGEVPARAHQELDPEQHIVVMCHHGVRSLNVAVWLRQGFEQAQSLAGGIDRWSLEIDPAVPRY